MPADWLAILPHLLLAGGGTLVFLAGAFWRRPGELLFVLALLTAAAAGAAAALAPPGGLTFGAVLDVSGFARYFTFLFAAITCLTLLFVRQYARARNFAGDEFYGLLLFAALGMTLVAGALDWLVFFLGLELLSISLYVLIAIRKGEPSGNEAGLKYFIMGAVASAFLTFGIALLYAACGTLGIGPSLLASFLPGSDLPLILLGLSLILVGVGFKISLVPFHLWTPDVYQGAPAPVTAFLSTGSKVALFAALLRFSLSLAEPVWLYCLPALWILAFLTLVVGNVTAVYQSQLKRLLAYSSVAQIGYLFMALLAVKQGALPALMFYLAVYAVMDLGAFGLVGALSEENSDLDRLEDCRGLGYSHPWRAAVLSVCLLSMAGLPPTAGFMGKLVLFIAVLHANFVILAVIAMLTVIISIYYYLKVVIALYMRPAEAVLAAPAPDLGVRLAGAIIFFLIIGLGISPGALFGLITLLAANIAALT